MRRHCPGVSRPLVLATLAALGLAARAADTPPNGAEIFHDYCSVCHGDRGDGRSRARGSFFPPPRDFTTDETAAELSRSRMVFSVTYGRPNTAMAPWGGRLNGDEIEAVVDYVRTTFMKSATASVPDRTGGGGSFEEESLKDGEFDPLYMEKEMPHGLLANVEWGKLFYDENCAVCHGEKGDGKGPRAYFILPKPRDYRHPAARHELNRPRLFQAIAEGSHGSEMPGWNKVLTHQEIAHVSEYIFQAFILPDEPGPAARNE